MREKPHKGALSSIKGDGVASRDGISNKSNRPAGKTVDP
jgi:hypothetical protein